MFSLSRIGLSFLLIFILAFAADFVTNFSSARASGYDSSFLMPNLQSNAEPEKPRVILDTTYVQPSGRTILVSQGESLQSAINSAQPGDTIALALGTIFVGNFILPAKSGAGWIVIRPAAPDWLLPIPGRRISPQYSGIIPKIVTPNADAAIETQKGASFYRLIGLEIAVADSAEVNYGIIKLGDGTSLQNSLEMLPHDLIVDRCYVHGNTTGAMRRGIAMNSARTAIIDSYVSECHEIATDTQAIAIWNGPGPFKIVNNYLEAAGENLLIGGVDASITGLVPADIEFRQNHCYKPLRWKPGEPVYAGFFWGVKNLLELKNARRILIEGNIFENNWVDGQNGFAILFTPRNQDGASPWSTVEDVTFKNNIVRHSAGVFNIFGRDDVFPSSQAKRIKIENNLFGDIGGTRWGKNGTFLQVSGTPDIQVNHNTVIHTGNVITAYGEPTTGFVFMNNIMQHNEFGVIGDGSGTGNISINRYFPSLVFAGNVLIGGRNDLYPPANFFPASIDQVGFVSPASGIYRLSDGSPYKKAGANGKDIGCDFDELERMITGVQNLFPTQRLPLRR